MEICLQQHAALEPYDDNLSSFDFEIYLPEEETPPSAYFSFVHFPNKILIKKSPQDCVHIFWRENAGSDKSANFFTDTILYAGTG